MRGARCVIASCLAWPGADAAVSALSPVPARAFGGPVARICDCAIGPDFVPLPAPITDKFVGANDRAVKFNRQEYRDWWKVFHDPNLKRLIQIAYSQNLTLLGAGTRVLQGRAVPGVAVVYPQLQQGTGSLLNNKNSAATILSPCFSFDIRGRHLADLLSRNISGRARWVCRRHGNWIFWGKFRRGVESADAAYLASIATYDDGLVNLLGDVTASCWLMSPAPTFSGSRRRLLLRKKSIDRVQTPPAQLNGKSG
jgi:outer membrane protein TolC